MLKRFLANKDGNYAAIFALAALPIFASVGMAVDYSNVTRLKTNMNDALDAACLATGKLYMKGKVVSTQSDAEFNAGLRVYNSDYFKENFDANYASQMTVTTVLPDDAGNTSRELKCHGELAYPTLFGGLLSALTKSPQGNNVIIIEDSTMRMRNLAEIALVLDNSGSMNYNSANQNTSDPLTQRMALLKKASKDLVTQLIELGAKIQQTSDPVKFSLIPFSASVNIGPANATASWMDNRGISPIHHENLDWGTVGAADTPWKTTAGDGAKLDAAGLPLTRFSILKQLAFDTVKGSENTLSCRVWKFGATSTGGASNPNCAVFNRTTIAPTAATPVPVKVTDTALNTATALNITGKFAWEGCVEARPDGLDITDTPPSSGNPASLFVPMFAPDSFNLSKYWNTTTATQNDAGFNNWWPDYEPRAVANLSEVTINQAGQVYKSSTGSNTVINQTSSGDVSYLYNNSTWRASTSRVREIDARKYYNNMPLLYGSSNSSATSTSNNRAQWMYYKDAEGPNAGCSTVAITPLTGSKSTLTAAIDLMSPTSGTNVPEGIAWGWRTISSGAPFTEGTVSTSNATDKVIIVLTDGVNTYNTTSGTDYAGNGSYYAAYGYGGYGGKTGINGSGAITDTTNVARIFKNTTASTSQTASNYTVAMNQKMVGTVNLNIADPVNTDIESNGGVCTNVKGDNIILMTVGLDLNPDESHLSASQKAETKVAIAALKACAGRSKSTKDSAGNYKKLYWNACSSNVYVGCTSLDQTFKEIADELSNLRFTQ